MYFFQGGEVLDDPLEDIFAMQEVIQDHWLRNGVTSVIQCSRWHISKVGIDIQSGNCPVLRDQGNKMAYIKGI